jgi:hypothetical protein
LLGTVLLTALPAGVAGGGGESVQPET